MITSSFGCLGRQRLPSPWMGLMVHGVGYFMVLIVAVLPASLATGIAFVAK
jgi:hypothetical protein